MDNVVDTVSVGNLCQPTVYRCSRGHEWEVMYGTPTGVVLLEGEAFCMRCILEFMRTNVGSVMVPQ
jgi:hypothetical protein